MLKKNTKHHTVETVSKSNRYMYKLAKLISLTDKYVTTLFPWLIQALQQKVAELYFNIIHITYQ